VADDPVAAEPADDNMSVLAMMNRAPACDEWNDAISAYIAAEETRDRAERALAQADEKVQQRIAEVRTVYRHLMAEARADG
jgi:hypothetical protein